ncbi:hypothetical protein C100_05110 [Sphingobium sp. C100]|jgi:uncharacterized protein (DUF2147 family)|uniref:DUF2147 domain-containing protein n=1 Tax=Sphingobium sp. C100 TaxID=1207055 RepID=UPI0003D639E0|nr:DUF2147 domain-containing protein [Sphingobium sp. C100]ETI64861.1 hypothetical protein C100_05110 [Sphingobium sp. C100]
MTIIRTIGLAAVAVSALVALPAQAAQPVTGRWATVDGKAIVNIAPCGKQLCGRIEKIVKPTPGRPHTDIKNPDPTLRSRPLVGLALLSDFSDAGDIWKGTIYDPESGKSYNSKVSRNGDGTLKVQGCIAFFCKTQTWTPVR